MSKIGVGRGLGRVRIKNLLAQTRGVTSHSLLITH